MWKSKHWYDISCILISFTILQEMMIRSSLETQRLELVSELSNMKLHQAAYERENSELRERLRQSDHQSDHSKVKVRCLLWQRSNFFEWLEFCVHDKSLEVFFLMFPCWSCLWRNVVCVMLPKLVWLCPFIESLQTLMITIKVTWSQYINHTLPLFKNHLINTCT